LRQRLLNVMTHPLRAGLEACVRADGKDFKRNTMAEYYKLICMDI